MSGFNASRSKLDVPEIEGPEPIAIIGIGCRLPGDVSSASECWEFLQSGRNSRCEFPKSRFNVDAFYSSKKGTPGTLPMRGGYFLNQEIRHFDNGFFGINNLEATYMDPQQRNLLEVVYECFESAGVRLENLPDSNVGCYVGDFVYDFLVMQAKDDENFHRYSPTGKGRTILSNRISHAFDLHGPSVTLDTACSSSLYCLHTACRALLQGDCDAAIVAAANLVQTPEQQMDVAASGVLSPTSTCHTFDAAADGYGRADAIGALYLKRLSDAIRDNDPIRSVIRATSINSNGQTPGITLPSAKYQEAVIKKAYEFAGLDVKDTDYFECHGTGTPVGDLIEVSAIANVYSGIISSENNPKLIIGSAKPSFGHSEAASGITSIIKATLALEKLRIPATVGVENLNPNIPWLKHDLKVAQSLISWPRVNDRHIPRVSINSFGYGGANAHCILDNANAWIDRLRERDNIPRISHSHSGEQAFLLPFSTRDTNSLRRRIRGFADLHVREDELTNLVFTLAMRRSALEFRNFVVCRQSSWSTDFIAVRDETSVHLTNTSILPVTFVFTGQGAQWSQMGRRLFEAYSQFRNSILKLEYHLFSLANSPTWSLSSAVFLEDGSDIHQPFISQTVCTAVQIALVDLLQAWGIHPDSVVGHSSGEIAAAYAAGHISATYAIEVAYLRGQAVCTNKNKGSMMAVSMTSHEAQRLIEDHNLANKLCVACHNSPENVTISGDEDAVSKLCTILQASGKFARTLSTGGQAYHSYHMREVGHLYEVSLANALYRDVQEDGSFYGRKPQKPKGTETKMVSTVFGRYVTAVDTLDPAYWRANLESPVLFSDAVQYLIQDQQQTFVEIGPHHTMRTPVDQIRSASQNCKTESLYLSALVRNKCSETTALTLAGTMWTHGYEIDFEAIRQSYRWSDKVMPQVLHNLPNYPWDHSKVLWKEPRSSIEYRNRQFPRDELIGSKLPSPNGRSITWRGLFDVANVPWIIDHKVGGKIVLPGACYISMAARACQQLLQTLLDVAILELRDVEIEKVMLLEPDSRVEIVTELRPLKLSSIQDSTHAWEFIISSIDETRSIRHASGCIEAIYSSTLLPIADLPTESILEQQSNRLWYSQFKSNGLTFGSSFQSLSSIMVPRCRNTKFAGAQLETLSEDVLNEHRQFYPFDVHPIITDAAFQTGLVATTSGDLEQLTGQVPVSIDRLHIFRHAHDSTYDGFKTRATAKVVGPGSAIGRCELVDVAGQKVLQIHNVKVAPLQDTIISDTHRAPILKSVWVPDPALVKDHNVDALVAALSARQSPEDTIDQPDIAAIIALKAIISPEISILQIGNHGSTTVIPHILSTLRRDLPNVSINFTVGLPQDAGEFLCLNVKDGIVPDIAEILTDGWLLSKTTNQYDVIILDSSLEASDPVMLPPKNLEKYIRPRGFVLSSKTFFSDHSSDSGIFMDDLSLNGEKDLGGSPSPFSADTEFHAVDLTSDEEGEQLNLISIRHGHYDISKSHVVIVASDLHHPLNTALLQRLQGSCLQAVLVTLDDLETASLQPQSVVLVTAELNDMIVANATSSQLTNIQSIANSAAKVIWMTGGGLLTSEKPEYSAILGLSRSVMAGNPSIRFAVLDIDDPKSKTASTCINVLTILKSISEPFADLEYLQKDGLLHVSRLIPADSYNSAFEQKKKGTLDLITLSDAKGCELHIRNPGQFDTLEFRSISYDAKLQADQVEVMVRAVGMNAKDLYTLSGKVDTIADTCSCEFSGVVSAVGSAATGFSIGDRVISSAPGRYRPVERVPASVCYKMRDDEDFTEMASVPMVYGTAIHALSNLAHLQRDETVLIHSAAGGVGTAAILLAKHIGAKIYATVGNDKKKEYLVDHHGLDPNNIFNSRDTSFLPAILKATEGRGVDVVLNSLTGARLHASLDACAKFGRFIEIGKRDILDAGNLNMKVFAKGITLSAFDLHELYYSSDAKHRNIYAKLLVDAVEFYRTLGYTASATTSFDVSDISSAFRYFANGSRIGKVAITFDNPSSVIPFVAPKLSTRFHADKSYLLVGCLGGLGRSISRYLLQNGARHFTFLGRSGATKPAAAMLVADLEQAGANVTVITGDVCSMADVEKAILSLTKPLGGVVQAAMGLSEALFPAMTHSAWHTALDPKIRGSWNLHHAIASHEHSLDFFLLTSSVSGTIGFSTESNYCVANCFLDYFAAFRRQRGLKATSVGLGPVAGAGIVHEHPEIENVFFRGGITDVSEDDMLCIIDIALSNQQEDTSHIITGLEPQKAKPGFEESWEMLAPDPRLSHITAAYRRARASGDSTGSSTTSVNGSGKTIDPRLRTALDHLSKTKTESETTANTTTTTKASTTPAAPADDELPSLDTTLHTILAEQLSKLVLMEADKISTTMYLADVGMDSTLAAQLRTCVFRTTGVDVSFVLLMDAKSRVGDVADAVREGLISTKKEG